MGGKPCLSTAVWNCPWYTLIFSDWIRHLTIYQTLHVIQQYSYQRAQRSSWKAVWDQAPFLYRPCRVNQRPQLEHNGTSVAQQPTGDDICELLIFHKCTNLKGSYLSTTVSLILSHWLYSTTYAARLAGMEPSNWAPLAKGPISSDKASLLPFKNSRIKILPMNLAHVPRDLPLMEMWGNFAN